VGGAFAGLDSIIEQRVGKSSLGFTASLDRDSQDLDPSRIFSQVLPEDLLKFGMIPEFVGRLPIVTSVEGLNIESLVKVLTQPKNALVRQFEKLFELDDVSLEFGTGAVEAIADLALTRGTGARGLRSILEGVLLDAMYDIPSRDDVEKIIIESKTVTEGRPPKVVLRGGKKEKSA
jgi:ATP-dependent Clp protease ATP-binding subunit ClpX